MANAMTEQEQARRIAEMWLDFKMNPLTQMVPGDPDCDACVLARQYIRMRDMCEAMTQAVYEQPIGAWFGVVSECIRG
jgi:hypothetical protein